MKKFSIILLFIMLLNLVACNMPNEQGNITESVDKSLDNQALTLDKEQMLEDYDYLWNTLEANYPFFNVMERKGIDWRYWKEYYRKQIETCTQESALYNSVYLCISKLKGFAHLQFIDIDYFNAMYNSCKEISATSNSFSEIPPPKYSSSRYYANKIEQVKPYYDKWFNILRPNATHTGINNSDISSIKKSNITDIKFYEKESAAYIKIKSFLNHENDYDNIRQFYEKAVCYDNIIIDITKNGGGSSMYWMKNIVMLLMNEPVTYSNILLYKLGENNIEYLKGFWGDDYDIEMRDIEELKIKDTMPPEVINREFDVFHKPKNTLKPDPVNGYNYKGRIWVLIDKPVYSAAEEFSVFCKNTGFATLVGRTTGGDGIGTGPALIILPNSKLMVRYSLAYGLNSSGSCNAEVGTNPDIISPEGERPIVTCLKAIMNNN